MGIYIKPFAGRNSSLAVDVNFLWNDGDIYIMDNHRCAYWCWMQKFIKNQRYSLFHIDKHFDSSPINSTTNPPDSFIINQPNINSLTIDQYLNLEYQKLCVFRWDNYLSAFLTSHHQQLDTKCFATYNVDSKPPKMINTEYIDPASLHENIECHIIEEKNDVKWIVNIDLDYFFYKKGDGYEQAYTDEYITSLTSLINNAKKQGKVETLTICLSPECCGGWTNAEKVCELICQTLGVKFRLPS